MHPFLCFSFPENNVKNTFYNHLFVGLYIEIWNMGGCILKKYKKIVCIHIS